MTQPAIPTVAVLLCTYHGERYLAAQLDSIAAQTHRAWVLWVSDDGSQDNTLSILAEYRAKWMDNRLFVAHGPRQGFVANFLSLACNPTIQADYYAFCDQDDVWEADKLQRALQHLQRTAAGHPALYGCRTRLVDQQAQPLGLSPLFSRPPCFRHALTQNFASGNTMVFNHAAMTLLRYAGKQVPVVAHDWWLYLLVTGAGGTVVYDSEPCLQYRQHEANLVGMKTHWLTRLLRLRTVREVWQGTFRAGNERQLQALTQQAGKLTSHHQQVLQQFNVARHRWLLPRLRGCWQAGIYREPLWSQLGLWAALILKKI